MIVRKIGVGIFATAASFAVVYAAIAFVNWDVWWIANAGKWDPVSRFGVLLAGGLTPLLIGICASASAQPRR
jgi:hypothetical protein